MGLFSRSTQPAPSAPQPAGTGPAISLTKVQQDAPGIVDLYKKAGVSLQKRGLTGQRAAVYLVLDRSGSMRSYYQDGSVQHLAEQALGLAAQLDDDGVVPVVFFDTRAHTPIEVSLTDYEGRINAEHEARGPMGTTNYADAMRTVIDHYQESDASVPALVIFQTDGSPDNRAAAERVLCDAAGLPIHWVFVGFGADRFEFLRKLDDLKVPQRRVVDNATFFAAGRDPRSVPDSDLYDRLMAEYPDWLIQTREKGIVR